VSGGKANSIQTSISFIQLKRLALRGGPCLALCRAIEPAIDQTTRQATGQTIGMTIGQAIDKAPDPLAGHR